MKNDAKMVSLGFTEQLFSPGVHICQIFSDDVEREETLLKFLLSGLQAGECTCCFSDKTSETIVSDFLKENHLSYHDERAAERISVSGTNEVYFKNNCFDPERMLELLSNYYEDSVRKGFGAARVIGEMTPRVEHVPGGSRLLEYESRVSLLLKSKPISTVCQYDAREFDGATILNILKVHPFMIIRGAVVQNPFFIPPETFLAVDDV